MYDESLIGVSAILISISLLIWRDLTVTKNASNDLKRVDVWIVRRNIRI
jgi:hypothetical protein